jgi:hypothetical protein
MGTGIFDRRRRTDTAPRRYAEGEFIYLNSTARPAGQIVRRRLQRWFARYPAAGKADLLGRLRSRNDREHVSAVFELSMHELSLRRRYAVITHPDLPGTSNHPDFLLESKRRGSLFLEAIVSGGESDVEAGARRRANQVYDAIDRHVRSPHFLLSVRVRGAPATPPPGRRIADQVNAWLRSLDPAAISARSASHRPQKTIPVDGWLLEFSVLPKGSVARERQEGRAIGVRSGMVAVSRPETAIISALDFKAERYGREMRRPYVIALNIPDPLVGSTSVVEDGLFGPIVVRARETVAGYREVESRDRGVFRGPGGPRNKNVSAVLIVVGANAWNPGGKKSCLYHNPWATYPLPAGAFGIAEKAATAGRLTLSEGKTLADILGASG